MKKITKYFTKQISSSSNSSENKESSTDITALEKAIEDLIDIE